MSILPIDLAGTSGNIENRLVVQVEIDARTGELLSLQGDPAAVSRTCSFLLKAVGTQGTRLGEASGHGNRRRGLGSGASLESSRARGNGTLLDTEATSLAFVNADDPDPVDQALRDRARPANILAALRREREFPPAALRLVDDECERELRSSSTAFKTSDRERELPSEVDPRDEQPEVCGPLATRTSSDARSGGNGNAAGPGPGFTADHARTSHELVSRRAVTPTDALDAFPPRSSGEGHLARGSSSSLEGDGRPEVRDRIDPPVGGALKAAVGDHTAGDATGRDRSAEAGRPRHHFVLDQRGGIRLRPIPSSRSDASHEDLDAR